MFNLKIVTGANAFDFSANPSQITDTIRMYDYYTFVYDVASGTETTPARLRNNTGLRIWDTAVRHRFMLEDYIDVSPSVPFVLPFTNAFLPTQLFDAIIGFGMSADATYDRYQERIFAFSNSPDNVRAPSPVIAGKVPFWCDINRSRANAATPYGLDAPYPFHFGSAISYPDSEGTLLIQIRFQQGFPAGMKLVFDWLIEYECDDGLTSNASWQGVYQYTTTGGFIFNAVVPFKVPRLTGASGWYKITVVPRENWLVSLLPHYHHGIRP